MNADRFWRTRLRNFSGDQSGAALVFTALGTVVLLGMAALTIDISHLNVVKAQVKNAADAGALAGARALNLMPSGATDDSWFPNLIGATSAATATVRENYADNQLLNDTNGITVTAGYWNLSWSSPQTLKAVKSSNMDVPAVKVTVTKGNNQCGTAVNGGPVTMFLGSILGLSSSSVSMTSVAILIKQTGPLTGVPAHDAFPIAVPTSFISDYDWVNTPSIRISSVYSEQDGSQWTSFLIQTNSASETDNLIQYGNPAPMNVGDQTWIEPGMKSSCYGDAAQRIGDTVLLLVVDSPVVVKTEMQIKAFVPFYIEDTNQGDDPYIQGHFVNTYTAPGANGCLGATNLTNYGNSGNFYSAKLIY